jgi:hypothetical protein
MPTYKTPWEETLVDSFCAVAKKINILFSVIPILHGSLGLQRLVDEDFSPGDIDVAVPLFMLSEKWDDLVKLMQSEGYELVDLHEKCFIRGDTSDWYADGNIMLEFGAIEGTNEFSTIPGLCDFAGIDISECPILKTNGAIYRIPTLNQFLAMYTSSQDDEYRKEKTEDKDCQKITAIRKAKE